MIDDVIDQSLFEEVLADNGGKKPAVYSTYVGSGGALGDAATAQQEAPVMVQRMKDAGVTTVVLFTDRAMNAALMEQATAQDWYPEWFMTGPATTTSPALAAGLPEEQSEHAFGISIFGPYFAFPPEIDKIIGADGAYNWFWGEGNGTTSGVAGSGVVWLMNGIHHAGPDLTPKTFRQGLFAMPAEGGAKNDNPLVGLTGYGKTTGLPYDAYIPGPADFAPFWMDPYQKAISPGVEREVDHASWYIERRQALRHRRLAEEAAVLRQDEGGVRAHRVPGVAPAADRGAGVRGRSVPVVRGDRDLARARPATGSPSTPRSDRRPPRRRRPAQTRRLRRVLPDLHRLLERSRP